MHGLAGFALRIIMDAKTSNLIVVKAAVFKIKGCANLASQTLKCEIEGNDLIVIDSKRPAKSQVGGYIEAE